MLSKALIIGYKDTSACDSIEDILNNSRSGLVSVNFLKISKPSISASLLALIAISWISSLCSFPTFAIILHRGIFASALYSWHK